MILADEEHVIVQRELYQILHHCTPRLRGHHGYKLSRAADFSGYLPIFLLCRRRGHRTRKPG